MNCYNHLNENAVGICKNCNKGLCKVCLTEIENGIACTTTCVEELTLVNELIKKNVRAKNVAVGSYHRYAILYGLMGSVFLAYGYYFENKLGFISILGILFLIGAIFHIINAKKQKDQFK